MTDLFSGFDHERLSRLQGHRLLVVGDLLLDRYVWGEVERISPEAPVPVVRQSRISDLMGGAMNVARNIIAAGGSAVVVGVMGEDAEAKQIEQLMKSIGLPGEGIVRSSLRPPTLKTRIMAGGQQLLRLDREETGSYSSAVERELIENVRRTISRCEGVVISDYRKGTVTPKLIRAVTAFAKRKSIPVVVDPKVPNFRIYRGADYLTPNLKEASEAAGRPLAGDAAIEAMGRKLRQSYGGRGIVITRGAEGLSYIGRGKPIHIPTQAREVFDVTGAGDTLIAHFTLALAAGFSPEEAARIGNVAAGVAVSKLGAVTVSPHELAAAMGGERNLCKVRSIDDLRLLTDHLRSEGRQIVLTNGCFDLFHAGHVRLLHEARALGDVLIVALNTDQSVRRIKGAPRPILPASERAAVLSSLAAVDYVVFFDEDTPHHLLSELRPNILLKGKRPGEKVIGGEVVRSYGGRVVELPLSPASSTGDIVRKIRRA
ncbi:D-glycero-beta-D-manno-heptose-7-phosphate kinase [Candidatus Sumerlaeota bacterium]|nr:D-glycero-beta-D-manno-heptose-7-phosphate kinase [Candidatus Sumerlaeota bacterium]